MLTLSDLDETAEKKIKKSLCKKFGRLMTPRVIQLSASPNWLAEQSQHTLSRHRTPLTLKGARFSAAWLVFSRHIVHAPKLTHYWAGGGQGDRSRDGQVHEGGTVDGDAVDGVVVASASVAKFVRMIAAAPRSTARLSPRVVAMAPNARASAPIDR